MTVGAEVFLDTNVLIYAALGKVSAPEKYAVARRIVVEEHYATSAQVLSEFFVNAVRKGERPLTREEAARWVRVIARKPCQPVDVRVVSAGIEIAARYDVSFWDATIVAAAERLGAKTIFSEDLNHGQLYGAVRVINPFRSA